MEQPSGLSGQVVEILDAELDALLCRKVDDAALARLLERIRTSGGFVMSAAGLDRLLADLAVHGASKVEEQDAERWDGLS